MNKHENLISSWHLQDHGELGSLLGLLQLLLSLAELGQVESGDLLGLLALLLVSLDLHLKLAGELGHAILVLLVLGLGEVKLLGFALGSLESLGGLSSAGLSGSQLGLQLADLALHLGHGGLASLQSGIFRISQATLQLSESVGERVLASGQAGDVLLLRAQLVSQAGGVNHRLLSLVLGILGGDKHSVDLSLEGVDAGLQLALGSHITTVDGLHVVDGSTRVSNVILELSDGAVGSIKESLALLHLSRESSSLALRDSNLLTDLSPGAGLVLETLDSFTELGLVALDGLDTLRVGLVGVIQSDLELVDLALQLLLDTQGLSLGSLLSLNGSSQRLHGAGVILPGVVELFLLLSDAPVNLLTDIGELKLGAEDLVLLHLEHAALFVKSVDRATALSQLIEQILDLVSEVLVLPLDDIQLLSGLLLGGLQTEQLG